MFAGGKVSHGAGRIRAEAGERILRGGRISKISLIGGGLMLMWASLLGLSNGESAPAAFRYSVSRLAGLSGFDLWLGRTACARTPSSNWGRAWGPQVPPERKTSRPLRRLAPRLRSATIISW